MLLRLVPTYLWNCGSWDIRDEDNKYINPDREVSQPASRKLQCAGLADDHPGCGEDDETDNEAKIAFRDLGD